MNDPKPRATGLADHPPASWMNPTDAVLWRLDRDPLLRSTIVALFVVERVPEAALLRAAIERAIGAVPRLRQRVVEDALNLAPPRWVADPRFDLAYHVRRSRLAEPGTLRQLFDLASPIAVQPFDRERPPWELHCVDGLEGGKLGVVFKLHHALADGQGLLAIMQGLVDVAPGDHAAAAPAVRRDARAAPTQPETTLGDAARYRLASAFEQAGRIAGALRRGVAKVATEPRATADEATEVVASMARLLRPAFQPLSPLWRERSLSTRFDILEVPLDDLKRAARAAGGTLNDGFVAAAAGGLARHHRAHGKSVAALRISIPVDLRRGSGDATGNRFAPVRFAVPVNIVDARLRIEAVSAAVRAYREETALAWVEDISGVMSLLGETGAVRIMGALMKAVDFVASNLLGPPFPVYLAGARVESIFGFGPLAGAAVNLTLLSYDGVARIGVRSDPAAVADPERLLVHLRAGFADVLAAGRPRLPARMASRAAATCSTQSRRRD